ncbi:MAG: WYL domain-containing protein [Eubacteriales bacterium]|nr:WYL domain-containing protein [Eubacteriales bacterium]MDY3332747.1 WYL domain-containing protein [Gallibacter sp.]
MDNSTKLRLLYILKILKEQTDEMHFLTTTDFINILEEDYGIKSHRHTIKKDIEVLREFGYEIEEVKSKQNQYNLFDRKFDIPELKLLIDAVASSKFIPEQKSKELIEKLSSLASIYASTTLRRNIGCENRTKAKNENIYINIDKINEAINKKKKISFQYFKYDVNKNKCMKHNGDRYILSPLHLIWSGDYYYLVGVYDYDNKVRNFRIDRIMPNLIILDEIANKAPDDFVLEVYLNTTFRMFNSQCEDVELFVENDVVDAIIDRFGLDIDIKVCDDKHFSVVVNVAVSHIFFCWIFGFEGKVRIVGPESVNKRYKKMINNVVNTI